MDWIFPVAAAVLALAAMTVYRLWVRPGRAPDPPDPESERALRDFRRGATLGQSHVVGLDNTGHRR